MDLNPNHPTTAALREQWPKLVAALVLKYGVDKKVTLTLEDIEAIEGENICIRDSVDGLELWTVDFKEAQSLAASEGGRAVDS